MPKRIPPLSDRQVSTAKHREKQYSLFDGGGLFLLVTPTGGKLWRLKYRFGGNSKVLALGAYPAVSLADAREKREAARKEVAKGIDPGEVKRRKPTAQIEHTFEAVAREWCEKKSAAWADSHGGKIIRRLERYVFPYIGKQPVDKIEAPEVLDVLRLLEDAGTIETAHRVHQYISRVCLYAIATGRAKINPAAFLKGALPPVVGGHFAAPTDPRDVAPLLRAIDEYQGSFVVKCALRLAPLVFVRPGELRQAEWAEIDLDGARWNIPAEKMKMDSAHIVPLSRQAVAILREIHPLTGRGKYIFPCHRSAHRCMSNNAMNAAMRRMGFEKHEATAHGFRAMARTILDEVLQVRPDFIEHQLAHAVRDPNGRAYNRTAHLAERRKMMQQWADYLDGLKRKAPPERG